MKKNILLFLVVLSTVSTNGQISETLVENKVKKINILYPGYEMEFGVSNTTTWGFLVGFKVRGYYGEDRSDIFLVQNSNQTVYAFDLVPNLDVYYRWYYNLKKRENKGKNIVNNSGSYLFTGAFVNSPGLNLKEKNYELEDYFYYGPYLGWGVRWSSKSEKLVFDLNARVQHTFEGTNDNFTKLAVGFLIGYKL